MANKRFLTMKTSLPDFVQTKNALGVNEKGRVQRFVTDEIHTRLADYIPLKSGRLRTSSHIQTPTKIRIDAPYARAQFFGVTKSGKPFNYSRTGAKVGPHWDRRLMQSEGEAIVAEANRFVRRKR